MMLDLSRAHARPWGSYWFQRYVQAGEAWLGVNVWYRSEIATLGTLTNVLPSCQDLYQLWGAVTTALGAQGLARIGQSVF